MRLPGHRALSGALLCALGLVAHGLVAPGCSTIADEPLPECVLDQDCGENLVCSVAQGNICVPKVQPPLPNLAFDIREDDDFRIEMRACDPEVILEPGGTELRVRSRDRLARTFEFALALERDVEGCELCEAGSICDAATLTCTSTDEGQLQLGQQSRLGLAALASPTEDYLIPVDPPLPEGELPDPVSLAWPLYTAEEPAAHWATQLDIRPIAELRGVVRRVIADEVEGAFELTTTQRCHRGLFGNAGAVRRFNGDAVIGATIEFIHDEPIAASSTVIGPATPCSAPEDCPLGWACGDAGTCALDLTNVSAGITTSVDNPLGGFPPAWMYTYCEGIEAPADDPLIRELYVRVSPLQETGLPQVVYRIDQPFGDPASPDASRQVPFDPTLSLCLPPWEPPHPINFSVVGEPIELAENELGVYRCCSTDCLPTQTVEAEPTPPPSVETCSNFDRVLFSSSWFLDDATAWGINACAQPTLNSEGANGRYVREVKAESCVDPLACTVELTHGEAGEVERLYEVELVSPVGSVFRSRRFDLAVEADTSELPTFELEPRVQLRGQIVCAADSGDDCSSANAVIAAERLRVATDEPDPLGPFYFQGRSDALGNFVLPVEPGVYVITGYPAVGQPGGPAPFQIVDLRSESAQVELVDAVPHARLAAPIELDEGVLVRAFLRDFDVTTGVAPLDIGSWTSDPEFASFDLNSPETCYNAAARRGCVIRRLQPTDATISLLLSRRFQFTARTGGATACPVSRLDPGSGAPGAPFGPTGVRQLAP